MKKSFSLAFTLSEVLITLGIIGVVAALTIPFLIVKHQKQQTVVQLKKAYAELQTVFFNAENEFGSVKNWDIYNYTGNLAYIIINYYKNAIMIDRKLRCSDGIKSLSGGCPLGEHSSLGQSFVTADGKIIYCFMNWIFVDLNGNRGPNIQGKDIFEFRVGVDNKKPIVLYGEGRSKQYIFTTQSESACRKGLPDVNGHNGNMCGAIIMMDGWQIKDDYPW